MLIVDIFTCLKFVTAGAEKSKERAVDILMVVNNTKNLG